MSDSVSDRLVYVSSEAGTAASHKVRQAHIDDQSICGQLSDRLVHGHGMEATEPDSFAHGADHASEDEEQQLTHEARKAEWEAQLKLHGGLENLKATLTEKIQAAPKALDELDEKLSSLYASKALSEDSQKHRAENEALEKRLREEVKEWWDIYRLSRSQGLDLLDEKTHKQFYDMFSRWVID